MIQESKIKKKKRQGRSSTSPLLKEEPQNIIEEVKTGSDDAEILYTGHKGLAVINTESNENLDDESIGKIPSLISHDPTLTNEQE